MNKKYIAATAAFAFLATPAFADDARTPPSEPFYAPQAASCDTVDLKVYFEPGAAELTPFARDAIRETREQLSGCAVKEIEATAKAGDADGKADKLTLAEARRTAVMQELSAHGIASKKTNLKTDISADADESIMSRNVDVKMQSEPAIVG